MEDECIGKLACENHLMPQSSTHAAGIAFMVLLQHCSSCFPAFQIKKLPFGFSVPTLGIKGSVVKISTDTHSE
jgi:hypothetical protein